MGKYEELKVKYGRKNPWASAIGSLIIPGLGQANNGQWGKAIVLFIVGGLLWMVLLGWAVNIVSAIDAFVAAQQINELLEAKYKK